MMVKNNKEDNSEKSFKNDALKYHSRSSMDSLVQSNSKAGKIEVSTTRSLSSQRDLALAYSPGVAFACMEIKNNSKKVYDYTNKANLVGVVTDGTAVLGLGDIGVLAAKPVMEGKCALFKKFAGIDAIDISFDTSNIDKFTDAVSLIGGNFGGINLEDIKSPNCFIIEKKLQDVMDIPVFHDDQHGTAIVTAAGIVNSCLLTGRVLSEIRIVINGAGAAGIACADLLVCLGVKRDNLILCDRSGVIYQDRSVSMNIWKKQYATFDKCRTLDEALEGADAVIGLSVKGAITSGMIKKMNKDPIIFAMANPDPEIDPAAASAARPDAIIATGRSDYQNQINNVMCFPYVFRGALDVRATEINNDMKKAAVHAIAKIARDNENLPQEVIDIYGERKVFSKDYIIPVPFDRRLYTEVSSSVARAAIASGVSPFTNFDLALYKQDLEKSFQ
ncbi:MAG TPA: malic enzyme-like NAD(P)-binding protein [Candidatus Megaira endosymbiont of Hartmannula sinica]|nr:malic enzyme-like NAD(P)-binding protein [Candidatus Megaera endosymbiont of Hartmannula sinica]